MDKRREPQLCYGLVKTSPCIILGVSTLSDPMSTSRFAGRRHSASSSGAIHQGCMSVTGDSVIRPNSKSKMTHEQNPPPHFLSKTPVLVLLFTVTGCSRLDTVCQSGFSGTNYTFGFIETLVLAVLVTLVICTVFYLLQSRAVHKWNLRRTESAPKLSAAPLFPFIIILLPFFLAGPFVGADCSDAQKWTHVLGAFLGCVAGCAMGFTIFHARTRPYKKKKSSQERK